MRIIHGDEIVAAGWHGAGNAKPDDKKRSGLLHCINVLHRTRFDAVCFGEEKDTNAAAVCATLGWEVWSGTGRGADVVYSFVAELPDDMAVEIIGEAKLLGQIQIGAVNSAKGRRHHWLWLTKQPQRMVKLAEMIGTWPDHLWAMTSVTSAEQLGRVRQLLRVPAKVRGISYEPALGPVDFASSGAFGCTCPDPDRCAGTCPFYRNAADPRRRISWLIVGGESGPNARPFDLAWARSAVRQCQDAGVAVFVKQLGTNPQTHGVSIGRVPGKGGDLSTIPQDLRIREFPQ